MISSRGVAHAGFDCLLDALLDEEHPAEIHYAENQDKKDRQRERELRRTLAARASAPGRFDRPAAARNPRQTERIRPHQPLMAVSTRAQMMFPLRDPGPSQCREVPTSDSRVRAAAQRAESRSKTGIISRAGATCVSIQADDVSSPRHLPGAKMM